MLLHSVFIADDLANTFYAAIGIKADIKYNYITDKFEFDKEFNDIVKFIKYCKTKTIKNLRLGSLSAQAHQPEDFKNVNFQMLTNILLDNLESTVQKRKLKNYLLNL